MFVSPWLSAPSDRKGNDMKERICSEEEEEEGEEEEEVEEEKEEVTNALVPNASYDVAPHTHQPKRPPPKIK